MSSETEHLILDQLREMRAEWRSDIAGIRADLRTAMIEVEALKVKVAAIAAIAGLIGAAAVHLANSIFFS